MMIELGYFAVITALMVSIAGIIIPVAGLWTVNNSLIRAGRQIVTVNFLLISLACGTLIYSFLMRDFSVKYVAMNSNSRLPVFYTIAALWGGHEGSLLFWTWILSAFAALAAWIHWKKHPATIPYLIAIESAVTAGFLALIVFLSSPFERIFPAPSEGMDLNPLLQDPGMVFHPPFLYLGYVGFSIPFSFAMAALLSGRLGEEWIRSTHRWTLLSWIMLTFGILMGGYWAYYELGWGGYWAWDPVENASFMPWLVGTAYLHSVMVQEKRKMFKVWNLFLIIVTFSLSLLGTFLVRSGILSSVHAFANDPGRGVYILIFMSAVLLFSFGTLIIRSNLLKTKIEMDSIVSRESAYLFNNLFLLIATATVFLGTLYPLLVDTLYGTKVTVGAPYYNKVFMPIVLIILILMGIAPMIAWRKASAENIRRNFLIPLIAGLASAAIFAIFGIRMAYPLIIVFIACFVSATIIIDLYKTSSYWSSHSGVSLPAGIYKAWHHNQRRYGGLVTHIGVLVLILGIVGSSAYKLEKTVMLKPGDEFKLGSYSYKFLGIQDAAGINWRGVEALFNVYEKDRFVAEMRPQKRQYMGGSQMPTTEAAIEPRRMGDLYLSLSEITEEGWITVMAFQNPLIHWIWYGGGIMGLGVVLILFKRRRRDS
ncbi:MAG: heme lyase CcmF/NrfE family subunit [Nitrospirae bacterium]|nr:heme lyase CcmF/NrfE family subunit [Nitrospirota bacterium]